MSGTESSLPEMLGLFFLLVTFFVVVVVAIKVLMGGKSGSTSGRDNSMQDSSETGDVHDNCNAEESRGRSAEAEK